MANPTTNYSFAMPTNTDLVKDLPADFDIFGQAVDDRIKALNPSTTLGDVEYRSSTANTNTRLGIGTTGQVLTVSGGVPAWATPAAAGGMTLLSTTTLSGASTTISSINQTYKDLMFVCFNWSLSVNPSFASIEPNGAGNCNYITMTRTNTTNALSGRTSDVIFPAGTVDWLGSNTENATFLHITNYANTTATCKNFTASNRIINNTSTNCASFHSGAIVTSSAITSMKFAVNTGNLTGTVLMYGVN
jgi:hypothetical protein